MSAVNGLLMDAAPEMLRVLEEFVRSYADQSISHREYRIAVAAMSTKVIAQAKGLSV